MLVSSGSVGGDIAFGKAVQVTADATPVLSHNGFGKDISDSGVAPADLETIPAAVVLVNTSPTAGLPTKTNISGGLQLDWGRWNLANVSVESTTLTPTTNAIPGRTRCNTSTSANCDVLWAVFQPRAVADMNGSVLGRFGNNSSVPIHGFDDAGLALLGGIFEFDVDLSSGPDAISSGLLTIFDSANATWRATFNGDIEGAYATMTDIVGTFSGGEGPITGSIGGAFTGATATPHFVGGFALQHGSHFVQGISVLNPDDCFSCTLNPAP